MLNSRIDLKNSPQRLTSYEVIVRRHVCFTAGITGQRESFGNGESVSCTICQTSQTGNLSYFLGDASRHRFGNDHGFRDGKHCCCIFLACGYGAIERGSICSWVW